MSNASERIMHLENVGVCYKGQGIRRKGGIWPLKEVTFDVLRGETLGVIGKNGAGKSTLLRLLAGIILPDAGSMQTWCDRISLLSLQVGFNPKSTGRENVLMSGMLQGMSRKRLLACMDDIIEFSELADFIDMPVRTYSSGMKARLGFALAMQIKPDVLLIDEVLGVGDEQFKRKSSSAMRQLIRSERTVILVSHQVGTIMELCDRAVLLNSGKTVVQGKPEHVLEEYERNIVLEKKTS